MRDEPLDLIPLVVLLGIVVSISMGIMIPMYREAQQLKYEVSYDKVVTAVEGQTDDNEIADGYSYTEMVLLISKQTYFMPQPRVIDIGGSVMAIQPEVTDVVNPGESYDYTGATTAFTPENVATASLVKSYLSNWCKAYSTKYPGTDGYKLCFDLRYTTGDEDGPQDDCYALYVLAKDKKSGDIFRLKCLANGLIETKENVDYDIIYFD